LKEVKIAVEKGIYVNIDNLNLLIDFGKAYGNTVPCCIRINPHVEAGGHHKIKTGHKESKFGIAIDYLPQILEVVNTYQINVTGLHVHTGSDFGDVNVFLKVADILFDAALQFKNIKSIDFGSGFKVPYKKGEHETDVHLLGKELLKKVKAFAHKYGSEPEIWFEPGKFLVSEAGTLLVEVQILKETPATTFVGVDSGLNHLIRPMMYDAYHEIVNVSNPTGPLHEYSVVGYICETDTFAWKRPLNEIKVGNILGLLNAGAYGFSMSSNYNSKPRPAEVLVYKNKAILIRKRETLQDLIQTQINVDF
jgi:diaminopimelate decarboxylase